MKKNPWLTLGVLILFFLGVVYLLSRRGGGSETHLTGSSNLIMVMNVEGVIYDSAKFMKMLRKYRGEKEIKALVLRVNSPGGVVGPSQEIYQALKDFRSTYKKPVVVSSGALNASGAYYISVGADKIVASAGTMMGSIGVVMEFANLEKLYDWAKIGRYTLTSGKFKDSGSEYRAMREDEKALFQEMIGEVYGQFRKTVQDERKLSNEMMDKYADGRVFTGEFAVRNGFADQLGSLEDATKLAAELAGVGSDFELFEPKRPTRDYLEMFFDKEEDEGWSGVVKKVFRSKLVGKPLYLMPGGADE